LSTNSNKLFNPTATASSKRKNVINNSRSSNSQLTLNLYIGSL
ncbi:9663_t:CDS:1, partial [Entrophospora sp. SA101]